MVIEFLITIISTIGWIVIAGMIATGLLGLGRVVCWLWDDVRYGKEGATDHKKFYSDKADLANNCLDHDHPWSTRKGKKNCLHYGYRKWGK